MSIPSGSTHRKEMGVGTVYFKKIEVNDFFGRQYVWEFWDNYRGEWKLACSPSHLIPIQGDCDA